MFISTLTIQSKVITDPYIKIKIPLSKTLEDRILEFNESLIPYRDKDLYKFRMKINGKKSRFLLRGNTDSLHLEFMKTFQKLHTIKIDSIPCQSDFVIVEEDNGKNYNIGFETYIGTNNLAEGKHVLVYSRYKHPNTDSIITIQKIPFWYYKD